MTEKDKSDFLYEQSHQDARVCNSHGLPEENEGKLKEL